MLGISSDSVRRYRSGKTLPQNKTIYNKLNKIYNKNRNAIDAGAVERKREIIERRSEAQRRGKPKFRTVPIYPTYMYQSPAEQFADVRNYNKLEDISEAGYVAAWFGGKEIPLEVQFIIHGENLNRYGKVIKIVGIVTNEVSPKEENAYTGESTSLEIYNVYYRLIPGLKKTDTYFDRLEKIRDFYFNMKVDRGYTVALLGYYFDEEDEL
jgi:hypothetical protein